MSKSLVIHKKSISSIMQERNLLTKLRHDFIVNLYYAFQDSENLFLVMDLMEGGDLRYHLNMKRKFSEKQSQFFCACIILGLEYIHENKIIHRDLKPENLVLDETGYVKITDMGIARAHKVENHQDTSGTPGYMAPEVMVRQNHSYGVDHYALGVLAYEFMQGNRPYNGRSRQEIREAILKKQVQINKVPNNWSNESVNFVNSLIQRKKEERLGFTGAENGSEELKNHPWFRNFDWEKLRNREFLSPFIPKYEHQDMGYQYSEEDDETLQQLEQIKLQLRRKDVQEHFKDYQFVYQSNNTQKSTAPSGPSTQTVHTSNSTQQNVDKKQTSNNLFQENIKAEQEQNMIKEKISAELKNTINNQIKQRKGFNSSQISQNFGFHSKKNSVQISNNNSLVSGISQRPTTINSNYTNLINKSQEKNYSNNKIKTKDKSPNHQRIQSNKLQDKQIHHIANNSFQFKQQFDKQLSFGKIFNNK